MQIYARFQTPNMNKYGGLTYQSLYGRILGKTSQFDEFRSLNVNFNKKVCLNFYNINSVMLERRSKKQIEKESTSTDGSYSHSPKKINKKKTIKPKSDLCWKWMEHGA